MEAGGFEPPSRDVSRQASTCLVALFLFRVVKRQTTGFRLGYFELVSPSRPEKPAQYSPLFDALIRSAGEIWKNGPLIKQPWHTVYCQLKFSTGFLARPTGVLSMRLDHPSSGRSRSPPYSLFQYEYLIRYYAKWQ